MKTAAIFLDRDGVINRITRGKWVNKADDFKLYPYAVDALKIISELGAPIFIITNQSGVHLGHLSHHEYYKMTAKMLEEFDRNGIKITRIYECLHGKNPVKCNCRKPGTWMIEKACREYNIGSGVMWVVGDMASDIQMALNTYKMPLVHTGYWQVRPIMVKSGLHNDDELMKATKAANEIGVDFCVDDTLLEACQRIYSSSG